MILSDRIITANLYGLVDVQHSENVDREETLIGAEEKYYIRQHDMADFKLILQKYGVDWSHSNAS